MSSIKVGTVLVVLIISLTLTPSLVAADYTIKIWTEKASYHVGETWTGVFWPQDGYCVNKKSPMTILQIDGSSAYISVTLTEAQLTSGSYTHPSIGRPWVAADVGSWTLTFTISGEANSCASSGTASFKVNA